MRRQDEEAGVAHADQHHQAEVGRVVVAGELAGRGQFVAVFQAGLVAVVAVGDEDRLGRPSGLDRGAASLVGDRPEALTTPRWSVASSGVRSRKPASTAREHRAVGIGIEAEDRAEVEPGGVIERQAVGLGAGEGLLVREDLPLAERLQPDPGEEPAAGVASPLDLEGLLVDVEGGWSSSRRMPSRRQSLQESRGPGVAVWARCVAGFLAVQLQADDVVRAGVVEPVLERRLDHVVGRRDHVGEGADPGHVVADPAEGMDLGHRLSPQ